MKVYRINKYNFLNINDEILLNPIDNKYLEYPFLKVFERGLSKRGFEYLNENYVSIKYKFNDICWFNMEFIFELVRQIYFPNKVSRFQAIFAARNFNELINWDFLNSKESQILKLQFSHNNFSIHDSNFLKTGLGIKKSNESDIYNNHKLTHSKPYLNFKDIKFSYSILEYYKNAFNYWSGVESETPIYEILVLPPAKVIKILK